MELELPTGLNPQQSAKHLHNYVACHVKRESAEVKVKLHVLIKPWEDVLLAFWPLAFLLVMRSSIGVAKQMSSIWT